MLPRTGTHVEPCAHCLACSLLPLAENPHSPPGRTVGIRAGPTLLPPLHVAEQVFLVVNAFLATPRHPQTPPWLHQEVRAHVELPAVLQAVLGLPLAPPRLHLPPEVGVQL